MATHLADVTSDGSVFVYVSGDSGSPGDLWAASDAGSNRRCVTQLNPHLAEAALGRRRHFTFRTTEGQQVGAGILLPHGWVPGTPCPTVVSVYPGAFPSRRTLDFDVGNIVEHQLLASRGYAVLTVDVPYDPKGPGDPSGVTAAAALPATDDAVRLGFAAPARLAIEGHSYGGYAVVTTVVRTSRFRAAIASAGAANLAAAYGSMYGNERHGGFYAFGVQWLESNQGGMGAPPWERPFRYVDNSPVFFLDRVHTPLLLIAGGRDTAIPWLQSGEVFTGMRRLGRTCTFVLYPKEGHVPTDFAEANRRDVVERVLSFLKEHLASS